MGNLIIDIRKFCCTKETTRFYDITELEYDEMQFGIDEQVSHLPG